MPTNMPSSARAPMDRPRPAMAASGGKAAVFGLVGLLVGLAAGFGAGRAMTGSPLSPLSTAKGGSYQDGYDAAKKKIDDAHVFPPSQTTTTTLNGTVKSIGANSIVVSVVMSSPNPLDEMKAPAERTINISPSTKISRQTQKAPEQSQKEFDQFQKDLAAGKTGITPPSPFSSETVKLSDLKAGDQLAVTADHDILNETSITATEINLAQSIAPPSPMPPPTPTPTPPTPGTP